MVSVPEPKARSPNEIGILRLAEQARFGTPDRDAPTITMNAVKLRIELKEHRATLVKGWRKKAMTADKVASLTTFQQYRRGRILMVAARYFGSKAGIEEIATLMGMTHQRVSAILGDAVELLESEGLICRNGVK